MAVPESAAWFDDDSAIQDELRAGFVRREATPDIAGYAELTEIGRGGQATVYKATQLSTRRDVALKVFHDLPGGSAPALRRFEREIDLVSSLDHEAIVTLHDGGVTSDGRPYLVMELVRGRTLDDCEAVRALRADATKDTVRAVMELFHEIAGAMAHAHVRGVIHRDLKPANILVDEAGRPHILDFGLARVTSDGDGTVTRSAEGSFSGSLPWASPEQARGERLDVRSDVYSLGVVFYAILANAHPYEIPDGIVQALSVLTDPQARRLAQAAPFVDDDVDALVMRCLSPDPKRRYQSGAELARDIERHLAGEPIEARRDSAWYVLGRRMKRSRRALIAASLIVVALVAALLVSQGALERERSANAESAEKSRQLASALDASREAGEREAERARQTLNALKWVVNMIESVRLDDAGEDARVVDLLDSRAPQLAEAFADDPVSLLLIRGAFGRVYENLGRYEAARSEAEKLLESMREQGVDENTRDFLVVRANIARLGFYIDRSADGIPAAEAVVHDMTEHLGEDDVDTVLAKDTLAVMLRAASRDDEAAALWREILDSTPADLAPERVEYIRGALATIRARQGDLPGAIEMSRDVVTKLEKDLGAEHTRTLSMTSDLALFLTEAGRLEEAAEVFETLVPRTTKRFGAAHPSTLLVLENHASLLQRLGRWKEAADTFEAVLAARTEKFGEEHPQTLVTLSNLAIARSNLGEIEEAAKVHGRILEIRRRISPPNSFDMINALNSYGTSLCLLGRADEGLPYHRDAVARADAAFGRNHWADATFRVMLANCLVKTGALEEASAVLEAARAVLVATLGEDHGNTKTADAVAEELEKARAAAGGD